VIDIEAWISVGVFSIVTVIFAFKCGVTEGENQAHKKWRDDYAKLWKEHCDLLELLSEETKNPEP